LFGDADRAIHCARGLRQHGLIARAYAAADRAAATVKESQAHIVLATYLEQGDLSLVQFPPRCQIASVLVAVGIAEHDFLHVVSGLEQVPIRLQRQQSCHDGTAAAQVVYGLEQRHDVEIDPLSLRIIQSHFLEQ
jgi:hypothetical protein